MIQFLVSLLVRHQTIRLVELSRETVVLGGLLRCLLLQGF